MQTLIESHIGYAHAIAAEILKKHPTADRRDLRSSAELGLVQAAKDYDSTRGVSFATFSYYRIRGAIYDEVRQNCRASKCETAPNDYTMNYPARVCADSRTRSVGGDRDEINSYLVTTCLPSPEALPHRSAAAAKESPADQLLLKEQRDRVRRALQQLPERYRVVLDAYYYQDRSFKEIGDDLTLSESWVSRIHAKAIKLMCDVLQQDESADKTPDVGGSRHKAFPLKKSKSYIPHPITGKQRHGSNNS